jgi:hypothetical protein
MQQFVLWVKIFIPPFELTSSQGRCNNGKKDSDAEGKERDR